MKKYGKRKFLGNLLKNLTFRGGGGGGVLTKKHYRWRIASKEGLRKFVDLRGLVRKRVEVVYLREG